MSIKKFIYLEEQRQKETINLIASENIIDSDIQEALGSVFHNKYAEGLPYKRYYKGCKIVDEMENEVISLCNKLFKSQYANVQAHSGSQANHSIILALLELNDTILSLSLKDGGHLTHGFHNNLTGKFYNIINFKLNSNGDIDYQNLQQQIIEHKPKLVIVGFSNFVFDINYKLIRSFGTDFILLADISHTSALIATNLLNHPFPYADIIMTTTHKGLSGPKGAIICTNNLEIFNKINKSVFPGLQGGPHMNNILAKGICFEKALQPSFKIYTQNIINNMKALGNALAQENFDVTYNSNHIIMIHCNSKQQADQWADNLENNNIIVNVNQTFKGFGLRLGTNIISKTMNPEQMIDLAKLIKKICYTCV